MSETIKTIGEIAGKSIAQDTHTHIINTAAGTTAITAGVVNKGSEGAAEAGWLLTDLGVWLPTMGAFAATCVSCALFYKEYVKIKTAKLENELLRMEIANISRRQADKE